MEAKRQWTDTVKVLKNSQQDYCMQGQRLCTEQFQECATHTDFSSYRKGSLELANAQKTGFYVQQNLSFKNDPKPFRK